MNKMEAEVADLGHAIGLLVRRMRAAAASIGLSLTESSVLARLAREGPATTAQLARAEGMKPQSMGATIASLEERGLLERSADPSDGRQMRISLTPAGLALRQRAGDAKRSWLAAAVEELDPKERETLFAAGTIMKRMAET
jgi:DNA-binding MarR family transcriptional regulator